MVFIFVSGGYSLFFSMSISYILLGSGHPDLDMPATTGKLHACRTRYWAGAGHTSCMYLYSDYIHVYEYMYVYAPTYICGYLRSANNNGVSITYDPISYNLNI